jgi:hypothetical protein
VVGLRLVAVVGHRQDRQQAALAAAASSWVFHLQTSDRASAARRRRVRMVRR